MTLFRYSKKITAFLLLAFSSAPISFAQHKPLGPLPGTGAKLDFETLKNCLLPNGKQDQLFAKAAKGSQDSYTQENLGKYNTGCNHRKLMQEGVSIHALHTYYQNLKITVAEQTVKAARDGSLTVGFGPRLIEHFAFDGTCFYKDVLLAHQDVNAAWDDCKARLNRYATDAALEARENMLLYNDTRDQMMSGKGAVVLTGVDTQIAPDISSGKIIKDIKKYGKLTDEQKKARYDALTQNKARNPQEMIAKTQSVEFVPGAATLDVARKAAVGGLYGSKTENLANKKFNAGDGKPDDDKEVEVTDQTKQASFSKALSQAKIETKLTQQQKTDRKDLEETLQMRASGKLKPLDPKVVPLISEATLEMLMDEVIKSANKDKKEIADKSGRGGSFKNSDANADTYDVTKPVAKPVRTPGSPNKDDSSIDTQIEQQLPDVINTIRSDVPNP